MLPAAAGIRLQECRECNVVENLLPVQWINQVPHRAVGRALGMFVVRQDDCRRNGHAQLVGERVIKELVVLPSTRKDCSRRRFLAWQRSSDKRDKTEYQAKCGR